MATNNLRKKLKRKREELQERTSQGNIFYLKPDTTVRIRILSTGDEEEFVKEVIQFYLGNDIKGVISPITMGLYCALSELYETLKNGDSDEKELSKKMIPRKRYLTYCLIYKDEKGKELNPNGPKLVLLTTGMYQSILDLFLDEDEWGDMTHSLTGYDLKLKRVGSGKTDTEYTVIACKNTKVPSEYRNKTINLEKEILNIIPSYEKTQEYANSFMGLIKDNIEEIPNRKKVLKKLKKKSDIEK